MWLKESPWNPFNIEFKWHSWNLEWIDLTEFLTFVFSLKTQCMSYSRPFSISITPTEDIVLTRISIAEFQSLVDKGEQSTTSISVFNSNDQKVREMEVSNMQIILKLRSNAGKLLRIKQNIFAIDSKQTISFDSVVSSFGWFLVRIPSKIVDDIIKKYNDSKVLDSWTRLFHFHL